MGIYFIKNLFAVLHCSLLYVPLTAGLIDTFCIPNFFYMVYYIIKIKKLDAETHQYLAKVNLANPGLLNLVLLCSYLLVFFIAQLFGINVMEYFSYWELLDAPIAWFYTFIFYCLYIFRIKYYFKTLKIDFIGLFILFFGVYYVINLVLYLFILPALIH